MKRREFITLLGGAAGMAARGARAAAGKLPTIGFLGVSTSAGWAIGPPPLCGDWASSAGPRAARGDRVSLGRGTRRALCRDRGRVRPPQGRRHCHRGLPRPRSQAGNLDDPYRVRAGSRTRLASGLVTSLARPGGNVTGLSTQSNDTASKRLEILRELIPGFRRLAVLGNRRLCRLGRGDARGSGRRARARPRSRQA